MPMRTTEMRHPMEAQQQTTTREPLPEYNANGEASPSSSDPERTGPEPRLVTAATARRRCLWDDGILVLQENSIVLGPIDEGLTAESVHSNPVREPEELLLQPDQEIVFVPSGPEETGGNVSPLRVHRRWTVVRVRTDTASRYGGVYRLLTAAECTPEPVGEDLSRLTWAHVYSSIPAAKRAERILQRANDLATA